MHYKVAGNTQVHNCQAALFNRSPSFIHAFSGNLNAAGIEHHTYWASKRCSGQIMGKLGTHNPRVSMRPGDLSPNGADRGSVNRLVALVDVDYTLSQVEISLCLGIHIFQLDEGS